MENSLKRNYSILSLTMIARLFISSILAMFFSILIVRDYGSEVNVVYKSIFSIFSYFSIIDGGFVGYSVSKLYKAFKNDDKEQVKRILYETRQIFKIITYVYLLFMIVIPITFAFVYSSKEISWFVIFLFSIIAYSEWLVQYVFSYKYWMIMQGNNKIFIFNIVYLIISTLGNSLLLIFVIVLRPTTIIETVDHKEIIRIINYNYYWLIVFPAITALTNTCINIFPIYYVKKNHAWLFEKTEHIKVRSSSIFKSFFPSFIYKISLVVIWNVDIYVLNITKVNHESIANLIISTFVIFNTFSYTLTSFLKVFITSMESNIVFSKATSNTMTIDRKSTIKILNFVILLGILGMFGTFLLIRVFAPLFFGASNYIHYSNFIAILFGLIVFFSLIRELINSIIVIKNQYNIVYKYSIIEVILNIAISIILGYFLTIWGVLIGTVLTIFIFNILYLIKIQQKWTNTKVILSWCGTSAMALAILAVLTIPVIDQSLTIMTQILIIVILCIVVFIVFDKIPKTKFFNRK